MTLSDCLAAGTARLGNCSDTPALDARIFIKEVCSCTDADFLINGDTELSDESVDEINDCIEERRKGLPVAYILGHHDFYGMTFYTPREVLVPRPDTEILVENAVRIACRDFSGPALSVLDLCAGTGCIGIAAASRIASARPDLHVDLFLSDISPYAYDCFSVNAENLLWQTGVSVQRFCGDLFEPLEGLEFDMILSNPPYVESDVIPTLGPAVLSEPVLALDGGRDGLDFVRRITDHAPLHLSNGGFLFMEIGYNQGPQVEGLFRAAGFEDVKTIRDYGGNNRLVYGHSPGRAM